MPEMHIAASTFYKFRRYILAYYPPGNQGGISSFEFRVSSFELWAEVATSATLPAVATSAPLPLIGEAPEGAETREYGRDAPEQDVARDAEGLRGFRLDKFAIHQGFEQEPVGVRQCGEDAVEAAEAFAADAALFLLLRWDSSA